MTANRATKSHSQQIRDTVSAWAESLHTIYCEEGGPRWDLRTSVSLTQTQSKQAIKVRKSDTSNLTINRQEWSSRWQHVQQVFSPGRTRHELCRASLGSMRIYTSRGLFTVLTKTPVTRAERLNWVCSGLWCAVLQGLFKKLFRIFFFFFGKL